MAVRILQFGASGQLGRELIRIAPARPDVRVCVLAREQADFCRPDQVAKAVLSAADIDVVVNAVGFTAVDQAETNAATARLVNTMSVAAMAEACERRRIPLIHVSTDYVFDGTKPTPYLESDSTHPLGVYGLTKRDGELAIAATTARHATVRTSWLYSPHRTNFVKTMLRLGRERAEIRIVDDQQGTPTSAANLANAILTMADTLVRHPDDPRHYGIFHYSDAGETTWRGFAEAIFALSGLNPRIIPVSTSEYAATARRPLHSRLDCAKIEKTYNLRRQDWRHALRDVLIALNGDHI